MTAVKAAADGPERECRMELMAVILGIWLLVVLASPIIFGIAFSRLKSRVEALERAAGLTPTAAAPLPIVPRTTARDRGEAQAEAAQAAETVAAPPPPLPPAPEEPQIAEAPPPPEPPSEGRPRGDLEETLAARWLVWIGALAVALSAVFLFRYAVDQGWLTPLLRVLLGVMLGAALIAGGDWTRRHPVAAMARWPSADYVPPALTAAGLFALYASLYAAFALFGLIGPVVAFVLLGGVSFAALGLAWREGWLVALLGLAAGYGTPALIATSAPAALPLFVYLTALTGGCLALMHYRHWGWFVLLTLAGALGWPLLWLADLWEPVDQAVLSGYALALTALFAHFNVLPPPAVAERLTWELHDRPGLPSGLPTLRLDAAVLAVAACGVLLLLIAEASGFNGPAFLFLGFYAMIGAAFALSRAAYGGLAITGAVIAGTAFLIWPQPETVSLPPGLEGYAIEGYSPAIGPFALPAEFATYGRALLGFAVLYGLGGFAASRRGRAPGLWAALSAAMPVLLFALGYARLGQFEVDARWGLLALALAVLLCGAAVLSARSPDAARREAPLAFYAAGCTAATALAAACMLREAWLTVAIAAQVAALGWIWSHRPFGALRWLAAVLTAVTLVRLVLNPAVLDYAGTLAGVFGWVVYGYGLPALAFYAASRLFRTDRRSPLVTLCEMAAVGAGFLMVALQLRLWTAGALASPTNDLRDMAVQSLWWLMAAAALLRPHGDRLGGWTVPAGKVLLAAAAVQIVLGQIIARNPLTVGEPVGTTPVLNLLALAYLAPAIVLWLLARAPAVAISGPWREAMRAGGGLLVFVFVTLQVRHLFWRGLDGGDLRLVFIPAREAVVGDTVRTIPALDTWPAEVEMYAYSAAWILFALAVLAIGMAARSKSWRYFSLAVLMATVAKVFLYDMADLGGLLRVLSFLGLGLTLILIARLYQRFVFAPLRADADPPPSGG